ncbi:MAG: T9SS type A sorting domain-containing protein [Flavobacterium sp.]|nr:T9SS type A sorting domain-containing protein [Pedobacter sp.]
MKFITVIFIFLLTGNCFAQVLSNNGAVATIASGTVVNTSSVANNTGTITNNGTISISSHLSNGGTISGNGLLHIGGNFTNSGSFNAGLGTVNFNGSLSQNIAPLTFYNLNIANASADCFVLGSLIVNGTLSLSIGNLVVGSNTLTFQNADIPLSRTNGIITLISASNLVFGTPGNTLGNAFVVPAGLFNPSPTINNLTINRQNSLTLNNQMLSLRGILSSNGPLNTSGNLTLLADATQTAMIDGSGTGSVNGDVTMQGYLPAGFGYKYLSSPFQAATVNEFADDMDLLATFPTLYRNDESKNTAGWVTYTNTAGLLNPLQGYAVNFGSSTTAKTFEIIGEVSNGPISKTLFNNNNQFTLGFNLVGNPYPSPIDWNSGAGWIKTNIDNALYFFNASSTDQYGGTYSSYINGISNDGGISNNVIPAMQGFFVHVSNGTFPISGSLSINNKARITTSASAKILKGKGEILSSLSSGLKQSDANETKTMLRIKASYKDGNSVSDPAVIYFDNLASNKFDKDFDALKLMNTDISVPSLYTIAADAQNLSINALPFTSDSTIRIPVGIKTEQSGFVNFKIESLNNLPYSMKVYFLDANTNVFHDLRKEPTYSVNLNTGKYDNRFSILFSLKDSELQLDPQNSLQARYSNGSLIYRHIGIREDSKANLRITNTNGQVLKRVDFTGTEEQKLLIDLNPGIYVITSQSEKGPVHKKIIVH